MIVFCAFMKNSYLELEFRYKSGEYILVNNGLPAVVSDF